MGFGCDFMLPSQLLSTSCVPITNAVTGLHILQGQHSHICSWERRLGGLDLVKVQASDWDGWDTEFRSSYSKVHALDRAPFSAILTRSLKDAPPLGPAPRFLPGQGSGP